MAACLGEPRSWLLVFALSPSGKLFSGEMFTWLRKRFALLVSLCSTLSFMILEKNYHNLHCGLAKRHDGAGSALKDFRIENLMPL